MDGKVIDKKDYQPGVTVPPFHPNCRGTTCPWFDDMADVGQRIARDNEGKVYYVPPDMTYREWEKTFQEGGSKGGQKRMLLTTDDPIREILGSAFDSHPEEVEKTIGEMNALGVSVEYRKGAMGYEPYPVPGMPGKIVMDPEASYSAWLHERTHVKDDENSGWKGFRNFADPEVAAKFEENAYDVEIAFAEKMGYNDIVEKLKALKEKRIREVLGIENG